MILVNPFHLRPFTDSVILWICDIVKLFEEYLHATNMPPQQVCSQNILEKKFKWVKDRRGGDLPESVRLESSAKGLYLCDICKSPGLGKEHSMKLKYIVLLCLIICCLNRLSFTKIKVQYSPSRTQGINWASEQFLCICSVQCFPWSLLSTSSINTLNLWPSEHLSLNTLNASPWIFLFRFINTTL